MLYSLFRPLLFALDAEAAHNATLAALDIGARLGATRLMMPAPQSTPVEVMGLEFPNRIGVAAGLDKTGAHIDGLATLGFGFVECGTVTPRPQPGNPRPRLFRLVQAEALINRLGFNNEGIERFLANVATARYRGILGLNIGKNFDTPRERSADDYLACLRAVYAHASYVTVNISSPNTKGLRELQDAALLTALLEALKSEQEKLAQQHGKYTPIAIKIAPDLTPAAIDDIAQLLMAHRMDAVIATNTTVSRAAIEGTQYADETGGLSGRPLGEQSTAVIRTLARTLDGAMPIIGVGGIMSGKDARAKIDAGATLVQLYTGLIYRGPKLVAECVQAVG